MRSFHMILDVLDEGIQVIDRNGIIIFFNKTAADINNLDPKEVIGKHVSKVFPPAFGKADTLLQVLETGQPMPYKQETHIDSKGNKIIIVKSVIPLKDKDTVTGAVEISRDTTSSHEMAYCIAYLQTKLFAKDAIGNDIVPAPAEHTFIDIIGTSVCMTELKQKALKAAESTSAILLHGEIGTGKKLFVQAIHNASPRRDRPFITQNCAALPEELLEVILFGTAKNGFKNGCDQPGLLEIADSGTIFLNEIDSMPHYLQRKLLGVISEKRLRRVGCIKERTADVRIVAAITRSPEDCVSLGLLKRDLYYRLNVFCLRIPPLRERIEDIPLLTAHFINKFNNQLMMNVKDVSKEVYQIFLSYYWPGNVRELKHAIESAMHMLDGDIILREHLPDHIKQSICDQENLAHKPNDAGIIKDVKFCGDFRETVKSLENALIRKAFTQAEGNISKTARLLGIPRQTLQYRLKKLDTDS